MDVTPAATPGETEAANQATTVTRLNLHAMVLIFFGFKKTTLIPTLIPKPASNVVGAPANTGAKHFSLRKTTSGLGNS